MTQAEYKRTLYLLNREKRLMQMKQLYKEKRQERIAYQRQYRAQRATA